MVVRDSTNKKEDENTQLKPKNKSTAKKLNKQCDKSPVCKSTANLEMFEHVSMTPKGPTFSINPRSKSL